jgi:hypothetical protein
LRESLLFIARPLFPLPPDSINELHPCDHKLRWKNRTGSSELRTVTALVRRICFVCAAMAASTTVGLEAM